MSNLPDWMYMPPLNASALENAVVVDKEATKRNQWKNLIGVTPESEARMKAIAEQYQAKQNEATQATQQKQQTETKPSAKKEDPFLEGFEDPYGEKAEQERLRKEQERKERLAKIRANADKRTWVDGKVVEDPTKTDPFLDGFNGTSNQQRVKFPSKSLDAFQNQITEEKLNLREAKRSVDYSMRPEERVRRLAIAKESGDMKEYKSLSKGKDLDNFIELESKYAYQKAKQDYLDKAIENGYSPEYFYIQQEAEMKATVAADEVRKKWENKKQEVANNAYTYVQTKEKTDMESVRENDDYISTVAKGAKILPEKYKGMEYYTRGEESYRIGESNLILSLINDSEYRNRLLNEAGRKGEDSVESYMAKKISELTEEEKNTFRYYGGKRDFESVDKYWEILNRELNYHVQQRENEKNYMQAYEKPLEGVGQYIKSGFQTPEAYFSTLWNKVRNTFSDEYIPVDTNSLAYRGAHLSNQSYSGVTDRAYDSAGGEEGFGDAARFLSGAGLSLARGASKLSLGPTGALVFTGLDTAGEETFGALERGASTEQALAFGTAMGAIEALTEKLPLDDLFKIAKRGGKSGTRAMLTSALRHSGIGAGEEVISNLSRTLFDIAIMRDKSNYKQYISRLCEENGITREEAEKEAIRQFFIKEPMSVATQSVISDSILGFGANVYSRLADAAGIGTDTYSALTTLYEEASQDADLSFGVQDKNYNMPNYQNAITPKEKFENYSLDYTNPNARGKAEAYERGLGYTKDNADELIWQIDDSVKSRKVVPYEICETEYGVKYKYRIPIIGKNGKTKNVIAIYQIDYDSDIPRLITNYVEAK